MRRAPHVNPDFLDFRDNLPYQLSDRPELLIADTARVVVAKDAPVIAAARTAQVRMVTTYDRKDLLSKRHEILAAFGVTVATPEEILANLEDSEI